MTLRRSNEPVAARLNCDRQACSREYAGHRGHIHLHGEFFLTDGYYTPLVGEGI